MRLPPDRDEPWAVRVVPNKFPVLSPSGHAANRRNEDPLLRELDGTGHHELITDSPRHHERTAEMSEVDLALVLDAYQARYLKLRDDPRVAYVIVFKNSGPRAGASLVHPHSQLVATPIAPPPLERRYALARAHYERTARCLYCDLIVVELEKRRRVVFETDRFVVFCPFASTVPFEVWIAPKRHQPSYGTTSHDDRAELAKVLHSTLRGIDGALGQPDFNYVLHTAPIADERRPYYLWHVQILPRVSTLAGFELGSGMPINTVFPEDAAASLQRATRSTQFHSAS